MKKIILSLLLITLLTGCGSSNKLLGKWYGIDEDGTIILTFNKDKTCIIEQFDKKDNCKYEYDDKNITIESSDNKIESDYFFKDNCLNIKGYNFYKDLKTAKKNPNKDLEEKRFESNLVTIPDVTGMNLEEAKKILGKAGFNIEEVIYEENKDFENGMVTKTSPQVGSKRSIGTDVTIYVADDKKEIIVEEYIGKNYLEIKAKLESYGINVEIELTDSYESSFPEEIVSQSVKPGTVLSDGDYIKLYISNRK